MWRRRPSTKEPQNHVLLLLISDEITEVYFNADRILHMRDGRIVGAYRPGDTDIHAIEEAVHA